MNLIVFDNYDSFTYNLVHLVEGILLKDVTVVKNDELPLSEIDRFDTIILSPGPGIPEEAGDLLPLIKQYGSSKKILGVCLGHQAIAQAYGGTLLNLQDIYHGVAKPLNIIRPEAKIFEGLPKRIDVGRYHSWLVNEADLPQDLEVTARDDKDLIMAMQHKTHNVCGVQFHPESILTPDGRKIMENWLGKSYEG